MKYLILLFCAFWLIFSACRRESINTDGNVKLEFSEDTIFFDTLLTQLSSVTKPFKIYNPTNESVIISNAFLELGNSSSYRINLNGSSNTSHQNIKIRANDSIWGFVKVTIDPNSQQTPFVVEDYLNILVNENSQKITFLAYGQNAHFHRPPDGSNRFDIDCNETWTNDLPHVIFGLAYVTESCSLNLEKGTRVLFYNNAGLIVEKNAQLTANGTIDEPVIFKGSRLDQIADNLPGQWRGIFLLKESGNHQLSNIHIKNAQTGLLCDTSSNWLLSSPMLTLQNALIENCQSFGLNLRSTSVVANNVLIGNCGQNCLNISGGGTYEFNHANIANYWQGSSRDVGAALRISDAGISSSGSFENYELTNTSFNNSIIYGNKSNELSINNSGSVDFQLAFNNCIIKNNNSEDTEYFNNSLLNESPKFFYPDELNFFLLEESPAIDAGNSDFVQDNLSELEFDLRGQSRVGGQPEIGCYQYFEMD